MIDYALILCKNYVGSRWELNGDSYDGLVWFSDTPKPTQDELDALWESTQAQMEADKLTTEAAKQAAEAKLAKLGLTPEDLKALLG